MIKKYLQLGMLSLIFWGIFPSVLHANQAGLVAFLQAKSSTKQPFKLKELKVIFEKIPMPSGIRDKFLDLTVTITKFSITGNDAKVSASTSLAGTPITLDFSFSSYNMDTSQISIGIMIPEGINIKNLLPGLGPVADVMTKLKIGKYFLFFSTYSYMDTNLGIRINQGLNIGAQVSVDNLLTNVKKTIKNMTKGKSDFIIVENVSPTFRATIDTVNIKNSNVQVILPIRIGIDFTKKPFNCGKCYIQKIYTAPFVEQLSLFTQEASTQAGLTVELKGVKSPLEFLCTLAINDKGAVSVEAMMNGTFTPFFGINCISIGPVIGISYGIMVEPPWIDKFAMRMGFSLGPIKGYDALTMVDLANGSMGFSFKLDKLDLKNLAVLIVDLVGKIGKFNTDSIEKAIPPLEISAVKCQFFPLPCTQFGTSYPSGLVASVGEIRIGPFAGGGQIFVQSPEAISETMAADTNLAKFEGHLEPLDLGIFKISGQQMVKLKDKTVKNCAQFLLAIALNGPQFLINADFEIPMLRFKEHVLINFAFPQYVFECSTKLGDDIFSGSVKMAFNFLNPKDFVFDMRMEQRFIDHIKNKVIQKIAKNLAKGFELKSASIHLSGTDIAAGKLATISFDLVIVGQKIKIDNLVFDFGNIDHFVDEIVKKILELSAFGVTVYNDTVYPIEAKVKKAGIWPAGSERIAPGENMRVKAGGADWITGLKVTIKAKKDIDLVSDFGPGLPGNFTAHVVPVPKFKVSESKLTLGKAQQITYEVENMRYGVGIEFDISKEWFSYSCK